MGGNSFIARYGHKVASRDGEWKCHYCNTPLVPYGADEGDDTFFIDYSPQHNFRVKRPEYRFATIDHIIPRSQGGGDNLDNLLLACHECNSLRRAMPYEDFKALAVQHG